MGPWKGANSRVFFEPLDLKPGARSTCLLIGMHILHHHLMTALNLNRNPRSIGVQLYIVRGNGMLDVDAMSSDGCSVHMLSEREYSIHNSN